MWLQPWILFYVYVIWTNEFRNKCSFYKWTINIKIIKCLLHYLISPESRPSVKQLAHTSMHIHMFPLMTESIVCCIAGLCMYICITFLGDLWHFLLMCYNHLKIAFWRRNRWYVNVCTTFSLLVKGSGIQSMHN